MLSIIDEMMRTAIRSDWDTLHHGGPNDARKTGRQLQREEQRRRQAALRRSAGYW